MVAVVFEPERERERVWFKVLGYLASCATRFINYNWLFLEAPILFLTWNRKTINFSSERERERMLCLYNSQGQRGFSRFLGHYCTPNIFLMGFMYSSHFGRFPFFDTSLPFFISFVILSLSFSFFILFYE